MFLESVDLTATETLYGFNFYNLWSDGIEKEIRYPKNDVVFNNISEKVRFLSSDLSHNALGFAVWDKLYSREIIERYHIRVLERDTLGNRDDWAEDLTFNLQYYLCISRIVVTENPVYLLSKHGIPEQQNDNGLVKRLDHMLRIFIYEQKTQVYREILKDNDDYWKIVIWQMRRYFYIDANANGVCELRNECIGSPNSKQLVKWIKTALGKWDDIKDRWSTTESYDYKFLLQYLISGNELMYKIRNYWLYIIKPKCKYFLGEDK